jgi:cell division protein FtsQ
VASENGGLAAVWRAAFARRRHDRAEVRRFTRRRRNRRRGCLIGLSAVGLLIAFVVVAVFTPVMSVRTIEVQGTNRLDDAEVVAALAPLEGTPLAQVSNDDVEALLSEFVLVQSYTVQRTPPSTLVVRVTEREPIGRYQAGGGDSVVDAAGVVLWEFGGELGSEAFLAAGRVALALPDEFRAEVAEIHATSAENVELTLTSGVQVTWGSAEHSQRKAQVLVALIEATADSGVTSYDVSSPDTPVTR